ncbi:MAG TPA: RtcB family protein [Candidatus Polarisedimenticolaceae bacterium]
MKARELLNLGVPRGAPLHAALAAVGAARKSGTDVRDIRRDVRALVEDPESFRDDPAYGELARAILNRAESRRSFVPRESPAPWRSWGLDLEPESLRQMANACALPVSVKGALMPDAHPGYGLPIGGVLATRNAVIPYAVGVDIACRMKMTVLDLPPRLLAGESQRLKKAIESETRFGVGAHFKDRREHDVLDDDWTVSPVTRELKDKAWSQLGTSGSGNHFVEFGTFDVPDDALGIPPGTYLALLTHSGSRGTGASVADHYSKLAMTKRAELPRELLHLAWLDLASHEGQEYWAAMELMGKYAAANHACIHRAIARHLGARVVLDLENHHNFAWKEEHFGETLIVHRKGATPAGAGVLGIIPGSMASPTYVVRGLGNAESMRSAAHGAGRVMSRAAAKQRFVWGEVRRLLDERGVDVISAGLDEVPGVYKDIDVVMAAQSDLVEKVARFFPRIVKMAPPGERPED